MLLGLIEKSSHVVAAAGFLSRNMNAALPYVRRHITVLSASLNKAFPSFLPRPVFILNKSIP